MKVPIAVFEAEIIRHINSVVVPQYVDNETVSGVLAALTAGLEGHLLRMLEKIPGFSFILVVDDAGNVDVARAEKMADAFFSKRGVFRVPMTNYCVEAADVKGIFEAVRKRQGAGEATE